jgi:FkbM family methyltransferase
METHIFDRIESQLAALKLQISEIRNLVGPFGVLIDANQMLVQSLYGIKYLIDPQDLIMTPQLIVYRQWEADLSRFFSLRCKPTTVFIDIGANFGYFTCLVAAKVGPTGSGHVYAIEPNTKLVKLLRANALINWSMCPIDIHPVALGEENKIVQLHVPVDRAANGTLTATASNSDLMIDVEMKQLDALIPIGQTVDLIKLDVEGHEYGVLNGARRVIFDSINIEIVMEWSSKQMLDAGYSIKSMLELIESLDLRIVKLPTTDLTAPYEDYPIDMLNNTSYDNVLLVRK